MKYLFFLLLLLSACSSDDVVPKPTGYPRIDFPRHAYKQWDSTCPYSFKLPAYAYIEPDFSDLGKPCYVNVQFPHLNATLHLSYEAVSSREGLNQLIEDAFGFAYKHTVRADDIKDQFFSTKNDVSGIWYEIEGSTASAVQFFATDSAQHYLRGALYINAPVNKDSLAPVISFLKTDMDTMLTSLKWKSR